MRAVLQRIVQLAVVLLLVTMFTSLLIDLVPGDVTYSLAPVATPVQRQELRHELHLDRPVYERYGEWVSGLVRGDLGCYYGTSGYTTAKTCPDPVADRVKDALPLSLLLMFYAQVLALIIAIPLGVATAYRAGSLFDKSINTAAFALLAIPNFVLALVLAYYVGTKAGWVDPTGYVDFGQSPVDHFKQLALPTISLAVGQVAVYMRLLRSDMIATLQEDFVTMARAKGLSPARILWRHALRPSSLTLLTVAGLNVGTLIGGAVVIENIFVIHGMGFLIADAIFRRQYVALQSYVAILALGYVAVNFLVDILYAILDPRIRHARAIA
ncbi:MAG: peptide/nickel transport system permease protein [Acidimicrobiaceae bacterium]